MKTLSEPAPGRKRRGRGAGEGTIYSHVEHRSRVRKSDGQVLEYDVERWFGTVDLGVVAGKRQRKYLTGRTREEVAGKLIEALHARNRGRSPSVDPARTTIETWLNAWLEDVVKRSRRPNTYLLYETSVRRQIVPFLGRKRLIALTRKDVNEWIRALERTDVAPRTIHRLWAVLHSALAHAVRSDRLAVNPASGVTLPRVERQEPRAMPRAEVERLMEALETHPDRALYALELATGLREGELLGLRWAKDDRAPGVDLNRGELRVVDQLQHGKLGEPLKRGSSRRVLRLRPYLLDLLHLQRAYVDRLQLRAGQRWQENNLVFPTAVGTPRSGPNLWLSWKRLLKRIVLPDYKFHELRHTAASLALAEGASLFNVSRMLGHSSIAITADTYGHLTDEGRDDVAARMERALSGRWLTQMADTRSAEATAEARFEIKMTGAGAPGGT
jgi:integrase